MFYTICNKLKQLLDGFINYCFNTVDILVIVHSIVYILVILFSKSTNLFVNLLTINGVINAIRFIKTLYENKGQDLYAQYKLNEMLENDHIMHKLKGVIEKTNPTYISHFNFLNDGYVSMTQKYFLFTILQLISYIINTVLWSHLSTVINSVLLIFALPLFNVLVINSIYFTELYELLKRKIKHITIYTLSKITTKVITTVSETCLDQKIKLDFVEFMDFFENYENAIINIMIFLKTVIVQSVIHYIKTTKNIIYYYVIDLIHSYQIERPVFFGKSEIPTGFDKQKELLVNIIKDRKWDELLKAKTVHMLFEFYESKNDNKFLIKIGMLLRNIRINFIRFMTLWSISTIYPLVGIALDVYYTFFNKRFYITHTVISYLVGALTLYFYNVFLGTLFIVLSDIIVKPLLDYIDDYKILQKYIFRSSDQIKYLFTIPIISLITYPAIVLPLILFYINSNIVINATLTALVLLGFLSSYNIYHLLSVWFIINTISNIIVSIKNKEIPDLKMNLLEDYIQTATEPIQQLRKRSKAPPVLKVTTDNIPNDKTKEGRYNICQMMTYMFRKS